MSTFALWRLFHRSHGGGSRPDSTTVLAVIAFSAATAIFLTVLGGVHAFIWRASDDHTLSCMINAQHCAANVTPFFPTDSPMADMASTYVLFAVFACLLLLVPFVALAGSAARLAASRRDERLAALRLAGATTAQVTKLTAFDATGQAIAGALIGTLGYFALIPLIMLITFQDTPFTFTQLWVGPWALLATIVGVALLALVSALLTLRRVAISPLGVTARTRTPLPSKWRAVLFVLAMAGAFTILRAMNRITDSTAVTFTIVIALIVGCFALINLVGSFAVATRARFASRHPRSAAHMIAMRRILDNPKRAWRNVSGIGLAVFIAGITSVCAAFANQAGNPHDPGAIMMRDIGTGGLLTLAFAAVLAAVSSGIMQSASVLDQADEYRMLTLEGTDERTLRRARYREVLTPLNTVLVLTAACSIFLLIPIVAGLLTRPDTLVMFVLGVALCYTLVLVGAMCANHTASRLNRVHQRHDD